MNHKNKWPFIVTIVVVLMSIVTMFFIHSYWKSQEIVVSNPLVNKINESQDTLDLKTIIHQAEKSVIQVEAQSKDDLKTGSGFLYNDKGDIITNAHVVDDAKVIYVRTSDAQIYHAAVVGIGKETDIAVIRVPQLAGGTYLAMGEDQSVDIGDEIIALGSPHGFQNTVTLGIISGVERNFSVDGYDYTNSYQISAQITHGNSGGPLISRSTGNVIGINAVGTEDGTLGFSIPLPSVLDKVEKWSAETTKEELDLTSTSDLIQTFDEAQLMEESNYIIQYFLESIAMRDYVSAYTLLGSSMQSEMSYADFRDNYIHITDLDLDYKTINSDVTDENQLDIKIEVKADQKLPNKDNASKKLTYKFKIGLENDQLKILKLQIPS